MLTSDFVKYLNDLGLNDISKFLNNQVKQLMKKEQLIQYLYQKVITNNNLSSMIRKLLTAIVQSYQQPSQPSLNTPRNGNTSFRSCDSSTSKKSSRSQNHEKKQTQSLSKQIPRKQQSQCTFKPQVKPRSYEMNTPVFDRLSQLAVQQQLKLKFNEQKKEQNQLKECTFKPKLNKENSMFYRKKYMYKFGFLDSNIDSFRSNKKDYSLNYFSNVVHEQEVSNQKPEKKKNIFEQLNSINLKVDNVITMQKNQPPIFQQEDYSIETFDTGTFPTQGKFE